MSLITAADVTEWLPMARGVGTKALDIAIAQAQDLADGYCGYALESAARDEYLSVPYRMDVILLGAFPVTTLSTVTETPLVTATVAVLTVNTDFTADLTEGILRRASGVYWASGNKSVRAQYTAGWTAATVTAGLKGALLDLAGWRLAARGDVGTTQDSLDGYSRTKEPLVHGIPASIASMLNRYRRVI